MHLKQTEIKIMKRFEYYRQQKKAAIRVLVEHGGLTVRQAIECLQLGVPNLFYCKSFWDTLDADNIKYPFI